MPISSGKDFTTHHAPGKEHFRPLAYALLTLAVIFMTEQVVEYYAKKAAIESEQAQLTKLLSNLRGRLEDAFNADLSLLHGLAAVVAEKPDIEQDDFTRIARSLIIPNGTLRNLSAAPNLVVTLMYPVNGNEAAIGLNYRTHPTQRNAALRAMQTGRPAITGPLPLVQGGMGIIVREPVFIPTPQPGAAAIPWGLVSAVIDADSFYRRAGLTDIEPAIRLALRTQNDPDAPNRVFFGSPDIFSRNPVIQTLILPDRRWEMAALPQAGWGKSAQSSIRLIRLAGILLGLTGVSAIYFTARSRKRLTQSNAFLITLLDTIPDLVWLKDPQGVYLACNPGFEKFFGHRQA